MFKFQSCNTKNIVHKYYKFKTSPKYAIAAVTTSATNARKYANKNVVVSWLPTRAERSLTRKFINTPKQKAHTKPCSSYRDN